MPDALPTVGEWWFLKRGRKAHLISDVDPDHVIPEFTTSCGHEWSVAALERRWSPTYSSDLDCCRNCTISQSGA